MNCRAYFVSFKKPTTIATFTNKIDTYTLSPVAWKVDKSPSLSPLFDCRGYPTGCALLHAPPVDMVAAQDRAQNRHQDRTVEAPVAERRIGSDKLAGRCPCIEDAVHTVLIVRVVLAPIQDTLPVIEGNRIGDTGDNRQHHNARIQLGQILFCAILLHFATVSE